MWLYTVAWNTQMYFWTTLKSPKHWRSPWGPKVSDLHLPLALHVRTLALQLWVLNYLCTDHKWYLITHEDIMGTGISGIGISSHYLVLVLSLQKSHCCSTHPRIREIRVLYVPVCYNGLDGEELVLRGSPALVLWSVSERRIFIVQWTASWVVK